MDFQFELSQLKHVFEKLCEFFHMKVIIAALFIFMSKIMDGSSQIIMTIFILLFIDTLTGAGIALRNKYLNHKGLYKGPSEAIFNSRGLYRGPFKFSVYFLFILVSRLVDKNIPFPFASPTIDAFLVTTEAYSIFENFAKMGFSAPTSLLNKLKDLASTKKSE
jgi:phage-related holin